MTLLEDAEWGKWNNCEIGRQCGVSESLVRSLRLERSEEGEDLSRSWNAEQNRRTYTTKPGTTARRASPANCSRWLGRGLYWERCEEAFDGFHQQTVQVIGIVAEQKIGPWLRNDNGFYSSSPFAIELNDEDAAALLDLLNVGQPLIDHR